MIHLAGDIWLDADRYCFFFVRKETYKTGKNKGTEYFTPFSFHSTAEQVSNKIRDLGLQELVNGDYKRAIEFFEHVQGSLIDGVNDKLKDRRHDVRKIS